MGNVMAGGDYIRGGSMPAALSLIPREDLCEEFPVWVVGGDAEYTIDVGSRLHTNHDTTLTLRVKKGDITDLGSVPKFSLIQPVRFPRPALLHDIGYRYRINEMINSGRLSASNEEGQWFMSCLAVDKARHKRFFDLALRHFCERFCPSMAASAPARIYYAVKFFGGRSFLNKENREFIEGIAKDAQC